VERLSGRNLRYLPKEAGAYEARSGEARVYFDVFELEVQGLGWEENSAAPPVPLRLDLRPAVRAARIGWDWRVPTGQVRRLENGSPVPRPEGPGRYQLWPVVELAGFPARRGPRPTTFDLADLEIVAPAEGRVPAGVPCPFEVRCTPPLPSGTVFEWTRVSESGGPSMTSGSVPSARIDFPGPGRYRLRVRAGGSRSPEIAISAVRASLADPAGKPVVEARVTAPDGASGVEGRPYRIVVEDPDPGRGGSLSVKTLAEDGAVLLGPVTMNLAMEKGHLSTAAFSLVSDRSDAQVEEHRLLGRPRGRVDITYRGVRAGSIDVGPMIVQEIPIRFTVVGDPRSGAFPPLPEIQKALDLRLEQANEIWSPYGRRFARASVRLTDPPHNLLLIRGRAGGVDEHGRRARTGALVDGTPIEVSTAWQDGGGPVTPRTTAMAFARAAGTVCTVERFENLILSDREAVLLRLAHPGGRPVRLQALPGGQDVGQSIRPLEADLAEGCEVASDPRLLSLEEIAVVLGSRGRREEGFDLFVFAALRSSGRALDFKYYPAWGFPEALADSALLSWAILDGSGRYPYALARVLGLLLLPAGEPLEPADTLFLDPLSELPGPTAHKRVSARTGARIQEPGRGRRRENGPDSRYKDRGKRHP
jgi:hypothetical protein